MGCGCWPWRGSCASSAAAKINHRSMTREQGTVTLTVYVRSIARVSTKMASLETLGDDDACLHCLVTAHWSAMRGRPRIWLWTRTSASPRLIISLPERCRASCLGASLSPPDLKWPRNDLWLHCCGRCRRLPASKMPLRKCRISPIRLGRSMLG